MELLSPCGTIQSLKAAVAAGADAVYFGLGELNARAKSIDFNTQNLGVWVDYCHLFGVKVYVTINVNVYDHEFDRAMQLVGACYQNKVDALIVSDLGLICSIRKQYPDFAVHVSTQAGIKNKSAAEFYKSLGVTRVVLARECSIDNIRAIQGVEKEIFIHGALCVAFSGNCLLSCYIGGKSGNRGQCRQPCRQYYTAENSLGDRIQEGYLLSTKDFCLDDDIHSFKNAGVDCLKIEGRLKSPEYVFAVTNYYRQLIDNMKANKNNVLVAFNRGGFTPGYFKGKNVIYTKTASHIGLPVGKILNVKKIKGFSFATVNYQFKKGDGAKILRDNLEVGGSDVTSCVADGKNWLIPVSDGVKKGDTLCLTRSVDLIEKVQKLSKKLKVDFKLTLGSGSTLTACCGDIKVSVSGDNPIELRDLTFDEVKSQLSKTGNTNFVLDKLDFEGHGYLPKSALNKLRNAALESLQTCIIKTYNLQRNHVEFNLKQYKPSKRIFGKIVECDCLQKLSGEFDALVYYPKNISEGEYLKAVEYAKLNCKPLFIKFPILLSDQQITKLVIFAKQNGVGVYADNNSVVYLARLHGINYIAGMGLNIANMHTFALYNDASAVIQSVELGGAKLCADAFVYTYGRVPLMHFEHCPNGVVNGWDCDRCKSKAQDLYYIHGDRYLLQAKITSDRCYYTLYSDKKLNINLQTNQYICLSGDEPNIATFDGLIGD